MDSEKHRKKIFSVSCRKNRYNFLWLKNRQGVERFSTPCVYPFVNMFFHSFSTGVVEKGASPLSVRGFLGLATEKLN
jgi:hypothetical protein